MGHCPGWKHWLATHTQGLLQMCNANLMVMTRLMALMILQMTQLLLRCNGVHHSIRSPAKAEKP